MFYTYYINICRNPFLLIVRYFHGVYRLYKEGRVREADRAAMEKLFPEDEFPVWNSICWFLHAKGCL